MRLYVPQPGEAAVLLLPWSFSLHPERRNVDFHKALAVGDPTWGTWEGYPSYRLGGEPKPVTLPAGTELVFDRVYVRQGADDYASLTFLVKACPIDELVGERFWSKLDDANTMDIERTSSGNPVGPFARAAYRTAAKEAKDPALATSNAQKRAWIEASKRALTAAREYVKNLASSASSGPVNMHLENIVTEAIREMKARDPHSRFIRSREQVMWSMSGQGYRRASDPDPWACSSRNDGDGNVIRELRFIVEGRPPKKLGGFRLTMRGTQVLSCEPIG